MSRENVTINLFLTPFCHLYFKHEEANVQLRVSDLAKLHTSQQQSQDMNLGCRDSSLDHRDKIFPNFCSTGQGRVASRARAGGQGTEGREEAASRVLRASCLLGKVDRESS